jgi:4-hydroxy-tetrahydrodipicolinate reductase
MIKIIVTGASGRMGTRIIALAAADKELKVVGKVDISDSLEKIISEGDVVIDFTLAEATIPNLKIAQKFKKAVVIGTTGHSAEQKKEIEKISKEIPVVFAPNMSVGVNVMWKVLAEAAKILGSAYDVKVSETHHIHKKDKPSGTALQIVHVLADALKIKENQIPVESLREGEVVGDHTTFFSGPGEVLEITHKASSRDPFALGAIRAAKWVAKKKPGLYTMTDVLGLKS